MNDLEAEQKLVFQDASKLFKKIENVKDKFQVWKQMYPRDYDQAYGALSLTGGVVFYFWLLVFEIYVKYELLTWQPFLVTTVGYWWLGICAFWYNVLAPATLELWITNRRYSLRWLIGKAAIDPNGPDTKLLSNIIEKVCVSRFQDYVENCFDINCIR